MLPLFVNFLIWSFHLIMLIFTFWFHLFCFWLTLLFIFRLVLFLVSIISKLLIVDNFHKFLFCDVFVFAKNQEVDKFYRNESSKAFCLIITQLECSFCDFKVIFKWFWCLELSDQLFHFLFILFERLFVCFVKFLDVDFKFFSQLSVNTILQRFYFTNEEVFWGLVLSGVWFNIKHTTFSSLFDCRFLDLSYYLLKCCHNELLLIFDFLYCILCMLETVLLTKIDRLLNWLACVYSITLFDKCKKYDFHFIIQHHMLGHFRVQKFTN